ncbi:MAG: hypothetical protein ABIC40_07005 [bacterium]
MARQFKLKNLLRFREPEEDSRAEQKETEDETLMTINYENRRELPPFQRVLFGAGDLFLAAEAISHLDRTN